MNLKKHNIIQSYLFLFLITLCASFFSANTFAQSQLEGVWKSNDDEYMIKITSLGHQFQARIVWLKSEFDLSGNPLLDIKNPDEKYRKIPLKGLKILSDLQYNAAHDQWINGKIYLPQEGKYYSCKATIKGNMLQFILEGNGAGSGKTWNWTGQN